MGEFTLAEVELPRGGGLPSVGFTANGRVSVLVSTSAASFAPGVPWLAGFVNSYSNTELTQGKTGHTGAVLSNTTGSDRSAFLLLTPAGANSPVLDSVRITQRGVHDVTSEGITTIVTSNTAPAAGTSTNTITFVL